MSVFVRAQILLTVNTSFHPEESAESTESKLFADCRQSTVLLHERWQTAQICHEGAYTAQCLNQCREKMSGIGSKGLWIL